MIFSMGTPNFINHVLSTLIAVSLLSACASPVTQSPAVPTPTEETIIDPTGTETVTANVVKSDATGTPELSYTATVQANSMKSDMQKLAEDKLVSSAAGTYYRVQDFTGEFAKLSYYHWWPLNRKPTNFAIRADIAWNSAMPNANPAKAGCGFVFHEVDADNLHVSFLSMDGIVRNYRKEKGVITNLKGNYAGKFDMPADSAKFMLVVDYQWMTIFVDNKQVVRFMDDRLKGGSLAFAVTSGSNNDFGTSCTFTNVELWEFD
jgi:hypothetical protein